MKYFIDTNIFIRVLELEDKRIFNECSKILNLVKDSKIKAYIPTSALAEIAWVLDSAYNEPKSKISKSIDGIIKLNNLKIRDEFDLSKTVNLFANNSVKFIDALIASNPEIQSKQTIVISYDKDFDKLGVIRKEPSQII